MTLNNASEEIQDQVLFFLLTDLDPWTTSLWGWELPPPPRPWPQPSSSNSQLSKKPAQNLRFSLPGVGVRPPPERSVVRRVR